MDLDTRRFDYVPRFARPSAHYSPGAIRERGDCYYFDLRHPFYPVPTAAGGDDGAHGKTMGVIKGFIANMRG